jgi:hypothetical protein
MGECHGFFRLVWHGRGCTEEASSFKDTSPQRIPKLPSSRARMIASLFMLR